MMEAREAWLRHREVIAGSDGPVTFLRHVLATVGYYRELARSVDTAYPCLELFPLLTRAIVTSERLEFLSSHAETAHVPLFAKTSGSTGRPLTVRFGQAEWYELN